MVRYFGARGGSRPETKAERVARAAEEERIGRIRIARYSDSRKAQTLGRAIAAAAIARGTVTMDDCRQAGLSESDVNRLYDDSFKIARTLDPQLLELGGAP